MVKNLFGKVMGVAALVISFSIAGVGRETIKRDYENVAMHTVGFGFPMALIGVGGLYLLTRREYD